MTDQVKFSQTQPPADAGAGNASPAVEQVGQNTAVSSEDAIKKAVAAALEERDRAEQSKRDKLEARITGRLAEVMQTLKAANITLDENQTAVLTNAVRSQAAQANDDPQPGASDQAEDYNTIAGRLMTAKGVELMSNDPELAMVKDKQGKEMFIATLTEALNAKAQRLQKAGLPLGGGAPAKPSHIGKPPRQVLDDYFSRTMK